jgi:hypothetical protein
MIVRYAKRIYSILDIAKAFFRNLAVEGIVLSEGPSERSSSFICALPKIQSGSQDRYLFQSTFADQVNLITSRIQQIPRTRIMAGRAYLQNRPQEIG